MEKGTIIYLGSDGLEDQNDVNRKKFGKKHLKKLLSDIQSLPLTEQKIKIEQALDKHMENTDQRDDILWMGIKV